MASASLICIIISLVLLFLAMISVPSGRFSLLAGGVFFYVLSQVINGTPLLHLH